MKLLVLVAVAVLGACGDDGDASAIDAAPKVYMDAPAPDSQYVTCDEAWRVLGTKPDSCDYRCAMGDKVGVSPNDQPMCLVHSPGTPGTTREQCPYAWQLEDSSGCCPTINGGKTVVFVACNS